MPYTDLLIYGADWALLLLRITVAAVFLVHGLQKRSLWKVAPSAQMPLSQLYLMRALSVVEPLAALGILLGFFMTAAALLLVIVMVGAIYFKKARWKKSFAGEGGWEFDAVLLAALVLMMASGAGVFSLALP